jgi:hypothetical protein
MKNSNPLRYSVLYSLCCYLPLRLLGKVRFETHSIGERISAADAAPHTVFQEISILVGKGRPKRGGAVLEVVFHASRVSAATVERWTNATIPYFAGLPGFCNKKFMIDREAGTFAGQYEWETVELAQAYARSYATKTMAWVSSPFPIHYTITDRTTNKVVQAS